MTAKHTNPQRFEIKTENIVIIPLVKSDTHKTPCCTCSLWSPIEPSKALAKIIITSQDFFYNNFKQKLSG